jgi:hypothetical protein
VPKDLQEDKVLKELKGHKELKEERDQQALKVLLERHQ